MTSSESSRASWCRKSPDNSWRREQDLHSSLPENMTIKRLGHISVVVEDLPAAVDFFTVLGMTVAGQAPIEGPWVDRMSRRT